MQKLYSVSITILFAKFSIITTAVPTTSLRLTSHAVIMQVAFLADIVSGKQHLFITYIFASGNP